jgi:hypothetical protein
METNINIIVLLDVTPCSLEMDMGYSCEMLVTIYQITRGHAPEDSIHRHRVMALALTNI